MKKINLRIIVLVIFIVGILLRAVEVIAGNYVFGFDQGLYYQDVSVFIDSNKIPLIGTYSPLPGVFQHPIFYWFLSIFYIIFKSDPYGGMVMMFLISVVALILSYFLTVRVFGQKTAVVVSLLFSFSYPVSHAARILWPPLPIYLLTIFYVIFIKKVLDGENKYFPYIFLILALITAFEIAAGVILFIPTIILLFIFSKKSFSPKNLLLSMLYVFILFAPLLMFNFRHENIIVNGVLSFLGGDVASGAPIPILERFTAHFNSFLETFKTFLTRTSFSELLFPLSAIVIIGHVIRNRRDKLVTFLLLLSVFTYLEMLLFKSTIWQWYLIPFVVIFIFILGIAISKSFESRRSLFSFISFVLIAVFVMEAFLRLHTSFTVDLKDKGGTAKILGKKEAIDYIYKDADGEKFNLEIFSPPVYTYPYDYLIEKYASNKYGYAPEPDSKLIYLLIEADPHQPWTYEGWLKTVVNEGSVIFEKKLDSGFIIQKREI